MADSRLWSNKTIVDIRVYKIWSNASSPPFAYIHSRDVCKWFGSHVHFNEKVFISFVNQIQNERVSTFWPRRIRIAKCRRIAWKSEEAEAWSGYKFSTKWRITSGNSGNCVYYRCTCYMWVERSFLQDSRMTWTISTWISAPNINTHYAVTLNLNL